MPKISKAHGATYGEPDPSRTVPDEQAAAETPEADETETAPAPDAPKAPETGEDDGKDDGEAALGKGQKQGQGDATDGATGPDDKPAGDEPGRASKAPARRRTGRG
jgi:hypothetical protein